VVGQEVFTEIHLLLQVHLEDRVAGADFLKQVAQQQEEPVIRHLLHQVKEIMGELDQLLPQHRVGVGVPALRAQTLHQH